MKSYIPILVILYIIPNNYQGGVPIPYGYYQTKDGFNIDIENISKLITPKTKILILNNYQNPMGASSSYEELKTIATLSIKHDLVVLSDDAYYEIRYSNKSPLSILNFQRNEKKDRDIIYILKKVCYDWDGV